MDQDEERKEISKWASILDDVGHLIDRSIARARNLEGTTHDPRIIAIFLLRRLRGHRNAFATLTNADLHLDAEIILRSSIETAICLGNLSNRGEAFIEDLRSDAARTIKGQIPIWFDVSRELGQEAADGLDLLFGPTRADGGKHVFFEWSTLATQAALPELYRWYKHLSGTSVHVTGVSVFINDYPDHRVDELKSIRRVHGLSMMCGAGVIGCRAFLKTLGYDDLDADAADIMGRMAEVG